MNYATQANRPNPLAAIGALGVPAAIGVLLIAGLAVTEVIKPPITVLTGHNIPDELPPPPPEPVQDPKPTQSSEIINPITPPIDRPILTTSDPIETNVSGDVGPITLPTGGTGDVIDPGPIIFEPPPPPQPMFDPVAAAPRGSPGRWVSDNDYRASWIRRGYEGVAGFTLQIGTDGRVTNCAITRSTGHDALDTATCSLLSRRARFEAARDSSGEVTAGSYSSSITWRIPE